LRELRLGHACGVAISYSEHFLWAKSVAPKHVKRAEADLADSFQNFGWQATNVMAFPHFVLYLTLRKKCATFAPVSSV
jgi:hypothetical protein